VLSARIPDSEDVPIGDLKGPRVLFSSSDLRLDSTSRADRVSPESEETVGIFTIPDIDHITPPPPHRDDHSRLVSGRREIAEVLFIVSPLVFGKSFCSSILGIFRISLLLGAFTVAATAASAAAADAD